MNISKSVTSKLGYSLHFNFQITQNMREVRFFNLINKWLGCGHVNEFPKEAKVSLVITSLKDIVEILIPILNKYNLQGIKKLDCDDFMTMVKLVENKEHLSQEDLEKIRQIKSGMNRRRAKNLHRPEDLSSGSGNSKILRSTFLTNNSSGSIPNPPLYGRLLNNHQEIEAFLPCSIIPYKIFNLRRNRLYNNKVLGFALFH